MIRTRSRSFWTKLSAALHRLQLIVVAPLQFVLAGLWTLLPGPLQDAGRWVGNRASESVRNRPWLIDIAVAFEEAAWGTSLHASSASAIAHSGIKFLSPIAPEMAAFSVLTGMLTFAAAILKLHRCRQATSAAGFFLFLGLTLGASSIFARSSFMGWTLACFLIVIRVY